MSFVPSSAVSAADSRSNLVNNSRFIGDRMTLSSFDILCCPPPLFHCFGLVLGMLAALTHGSKIVFPSETFDPKAVLHAISDEKCTALHGVPTMFDAILSIPKPVGFDTSNLRTGIIAGAPVPRPLMKRLFEELNMTEYTSSYGKHCALITSVISRRLIHLQASPRHPPRALMRSPLTAFTPG